MLIRLLRTALISATLLANSISNSCESRPAALFANSAITHSYLLKFSAVSIPQGGPANVTKPNDASTDQYRRRIAANLRSLLTKNLSRKDQQKLIKEIEQLNSQIAPFEMSGRELGRMSDRLLQNQSPNPMKFASVATIVPEIEDGVLVSADFKKVLDEIKDPFETTLDDYNKLATALATNERPEKPTIPYSIDGLAAKFYEAADTIAAMRLAPEINPNDYSVSLTQLGSCVSQDSALKTLNDYVGEMDKAVSEAQSSIDYLDSIRQAIAQLSKGVTSFTDIAGRLANDPATDWDDYFSSLWWDLDQHLARGIAEFNTAVSGQISQIAKNKNNLKLQADNLRSNLTLLKPNWCIIGGSWTGRCTNDHYNFMGGPASLSLTNNGSQGGVYTFAGQAMPTQSISITGNVNLKLTFGAPGVPPRILQGTFDAGYHQFTGRIIFSSPGLNMTCSLTGAGY